MQEYFEIGQIVNTFGVKGMQGEEEVYHGIQLKGRVESHDSAANGAIQSVAKVVEDNGEVSGYVVTVKETGYGGEMLIDVALNTDGTKILGVHVGENQETEGIGSGFIINEEGYILTNYHVIKGAKEVTVTLSDGNEVKARIVNYDENRDVAMLKISDDSVKVPAVVELGNSDALKPGEQVIAIGTPLSKEFNQTVTSGIVSAVNRSVETSSGVQVNLIQTDAAINPGNSGGPLVNTKGEVVGINNMKIASDSVEGIGFSIPINEIKDRIESLSKPILNLGISVREINEELSKQYNMDEGLYIVQVTEFSPAEKAGLQGGDLIVKFDGQRIKTFDELKAIRDTKEEGDIVSVEVVRNGENKTFNVQLEAKQ